MGLTGWRPVRTNTVRPYKEESALADKATQAGVPQQVLEYFLQFGLTAEAVGMLYIPERRLGREAQTFTPTTPVVVC